MIEFASNRRSINNSFVWRQDSKSCVASKVNIGIKLDKGKIVRIEASTTNHLTNNLQVVQVDDYKLPYEELQKQSDIPKSYWKQPELQVVTDYF